MVSGNDVFVCFSLSKYRSKLSLFSREEKDDVFFYLNAFSIVDQGGKDDNAQDEEEDEQHQLLGRGPEGLHENLETGRVTSQFEEPEDANDGEKLEHVGVLQVRGHLLQDQVNVEAQGGHVVDDVDTASDG